MKNSHTTRAVTPPHDAIGGKSVKIERFAWCTHAKARGIATPEYLGCGEAWDESPSRGAHNPRAATEFTGDDGALVAILPTRPELPELPPLARTWAQRAILALDRANFAQLRASGRAHKLPSRARRGASRKGGLVSAHLEDLRAPVARPIAGGRICTTRANAWCAEYAHPRTVAGCDRGPARVKRVKQALCHARRVKRVACVAHTMHTDATRKGYGTIIAALPLTPHLVRALEGGPWQYTYCHATLAGYATFRGWHSVCTDTAPEDATPTDPTETPTAPTPAQPVRRVVPAEVALARGLLARKMQVIGQIDAVVKPRVTED